MEYTIILNNGSFGHFLASVANLVSLFGIILIYRYEIGAEQHFCEKLELFNSVKSIESSIVEASNILCDHFKHPPTPIENRVCCNNSIFQNYIEALKLYISGAKKKQEKMALIKLKTFSYFL